MKVGIHVFRKDLRTKDNLALNELVTQVDQVLGVFVFDPNQIDSTRSNKNYHSDRAARFIIESVEDLSEQCHSKLTILYGDPVTELESLIKRVKPMALSFNADFTPYALKRDTAIRKVAEAMGVQVIVNDDDQTLAQMGLLVKRDGDPYLTFGAFYKHVTTLTVPTPIRRTVKWANPSKTIRSLPEVPATNSILRGGRVETLRVLRSATPGADKPGATTSHLSAYMNQGCISIREVYWAFKKRKESVRPIVWRDYFLSIYRYHPRGSSYTKFIDERYNLIKWPRLKSSDWDRFVRCETGFLLVDAAMSELQQTGFINSRARMIVATFWIKYLLVSPFDREYGSQAGFSRLLIDCCASQNKLNHQWVLGDLDVSGRRFAMRGTNPLSGRSMRVDNGTIKKYDPSYEYIKKWVPGYEHLTVKECKAKKTNPMYDWRERYLEYTRLFKNI